MLDDLSMSSANACVVPKWASTHVMAVGASFSLTCAVSSLGAGLAGLWHSMSSTCPCYDRCPLLGPKCMSHQRLSPASPSDILPPRQLGESGGVFLWSREPRPASFSSRDWVRTCRAQPLGSTLTTTSAKILTTLFPISRSVMRPCEANTYSQETGL